MKILAGCRLKGRKPPTGGGDDRGDAGTEPVEPVEQVQRVRRAEHEERHDQHVEDDFDVSGHGQAKRLGDAAQVGADADQQQEHAGEDLAEKLMARAKVENVVGQADEAGDGGAGQNAQQPAQRLPKGGLGAQQVDAGEDADGQPDQHSDAAQVGDGLSVSLDEVVGPVHDAEAQGDLLAQGGGGQGADESGRRHGPELEHPAKRSVRAYERIEHQSLVPLASGGSSQTSAS